MRHLIPATAFAATTLLIATSHVAAQSCLGLPTRDGDVAVAATASFEDDLHLGGRFTADLTGPLSVRFDYRGVGADDERQVFTGLAAYEFWLMDPSVCAVGGAFYEDRPEGDVEERLGIPVGLGLGKTIRATAFDATLFAIPQYVWVQDQLRAPADGLEGEETSNEFMAEAGVTLGFGALYAGGSVIVSTISDTDTAFQLRAGFVF